MYDLILVRYGEMTLKKKNYKQFQMAINNNIKRKCKGLTHLHFENTMYRFYIYLNGENYQDVVEILNTVVGLHSYSLCTKVVPDYDEIASKAVEILDKEQGNNLFTFKVETNRGNKDFPATSIDISKEVAKRILSKKDNIKVDVHQPQVTLSIDLRTEGTYIYTKTIKGLGGYPSGIGGNGLLMMSGGLDSPVAGFLTIKKGVNVSAIHYASPPYTSDMALQKVIDLCEQIALYTLDGKIKLYVVPFTKIQEEIHLKANPTYLVTLMRRSMYRIAEQICVNNNFDVIINGESIGQVASQTLESMRVVNEVTNIPIIRPLATFDKEEIIEISKRIKTYETSIKPFEDCCTVFVPEHPVIKPQLDKVLIEEEKCDLNDLIQKSIKGIDIIELSCFKKYSIFEKNGEKKFEI